MEMTVSSSKLVTICDKAFIVFPLTGRYFLSVAPTRPPRVIAIPTVRDSIALRVLLEILIQSLPRRAAPTSYTVARNVINYLKNASYDAFVRVDVVDFNPSINHFILNKALHRTIRHEEIINLINKAIKTPTLSVGVRRTKNMISEIGVPQGLSISNLLASVYMLEFDKRWNKRDDCVYFRFVDDILIFCPRAQKDKIWREIQQEMSAELALKIHPRDGGKSKIDDIGHNQKNEISYLGYTFRGKNETLCIGVRKSATSAIRQAIINIIMAYQHSEQENRDRVLEWCLNLRITGCIFEGKRFGWIHYYSQADTSIFTNADKYVWWMLNKRFNIPTSVKDKIKKFLSTLHEAKKSKGKSKYIPNFDDSTVWTVEVKREHLQNVFMVKGTHKMIEEDVERIFRKHIFRHVRQLVRDMHPDPRESG